MDISKETIVSAFNSDKAVPRQKSFGSKWPADAAPLTQDILCVCIYT